MLYGLTTFLKNSFEEEDVKKLRKNMFESGNTSILQKK